MQVEWVMGKVFEKNSNTTPFIYESQPKFRTAA